MNEAERLWKEAWEVTTRQAEKKAHHWSKLLAKRYRVAQLAAKKARDESVAAFEDYENKKALAKKARAR